MENETAERFVRLHAKRVRPDGTRRIHLATYRPSGMALDCPLQMYEIDDFCDAFDTDRRINQWACRQIQTHDPDREVVLGLVFPSGDVVAHVLRRA